MRHLLLVLAAALLWRAACAQPVFEGNTTVTWQEAMDRYTRLAAAHAGAKLVTIGQDDGGQPIHLFILSDGSGHTPDSIRASRKNILWITNGIHPGEPDGIDASLLLAQALLDSDQLMGLLVHTAVCIVPVYNVSGALNRGSTSRSSQNGPLAYGFRGNAKNLDLNRDFMKLGSENARALVSALTAWDPDIYFETHVSDGADHQYIMALLATQKDKLAPPLAEYMTGVLVPEQYRWMGEKGLLMCPYFETGGKAPEQGLHGFYDSPRYSTGYNALFDRIGIVSESHVLKPYAERVNATLQLLLGTLAAMDQHPQALREARASAKEWTRSQAAFGMNWRLDPDAVDSIPWKGYAATSDTSSVTGLPQLRYHRDVPTDVRVPWRDSYHPSLTATKPKAYAVPGQWTETIERLRLNGVAMEVLEKDTVLLAEQDSIGSFTTVPMPYEGHYLHRDIQAERRLKELRLHAGDHLVPMGRATDRYVMEALECRAEDGFFAWNFFDAVLHQKEWFDSYVFEPMAERLLAHDPGLRNAFEAERLRDPAFAQDATAQLIWLYRRSPWMEPTWRRHPVLRLPE